MRLRHIVATMGLTWMLGTSAYAVGPDEDYVRIYKIIVEADALRNTGQNGDALRLYRSAQEALDRFQKAYPAWNDRLVNYRVGYVADQIKPLQNAPAVVSVPTPAPAPNTVTSPTPAPPAAPQTPSPSPATTAAVPAPTPSPEAEQLRQENLQLKQMAARLEAKLKEALSVQPVPANDAQALEAVQSKLREVAKENDLLKASLKEQQDKVAAAQAAAAKAAATPPPTPVPPPPAAPPKPVVVVTNDPAVLADLNTLRQNITNQLTRLAVLQTENDVLKKELATAKATPPAAPVNPEVEKQLQQATRDLQAFQTANQQLKDRQAQLEKQLTEARQTQGTQAEKLKQVEQLERDLATTRSEATKLSEQKLALEKRLADTAKTADAGSSTHILRLEKQLIESQSEARLLQRQKSTLEERLSAAQSQAGKVVAPDSQPTVIIPGAGGQAVSADVNRQLKQASWEVLSLQGANQELQKKAASLEKQLASLNTTKATFDNVDADRLRKLEAIQQELGESKRQAAKLEQENQQIARQLAAEREARTALAGNDRSDVSRKLEDALKQLQRAEASNNELQRKNSTLEKEVADLRTALKSASVAASTPAPAPIVKSNPETERQLAEAKNRLALLEAEKTDLEKRLNQAEQQGQSKRSTGRTRSRDIDREMAALKARLDVLEAKPIPYTEAELSLFSRLEINLASPSSNTSPNTPGSEIAGTSQGQSSNRANAPVPSQAETLTPKPANSTQSPPAGTSELMTEARRDFDSGRFADAERKFLEVLKKDNQNVYVLNHLAAAQFEQQKLKEADTTVAKALQLAPDDPAALYMLGTVRLREDKIDDAVDALSRAAKISPENAITHNALGVALSSKGLRDPAETAFRRAIQLRPEYADAHYNLAVEYALQKPPSYKLAHFHYQRALAAGHARSPELEKHIERAGSGVTQP